MLKKALRLLLFARISCATFHFGSSSVLCWNISTTERSC